MTRFETATIGGLREGNQTAIERAGDRLLKATTLQDARLESKRAPLLEIGDRAQRAREVISELLADRRTIEAGASTKEQQKENYVRLGDIKAVDGIDLTGEALLKFLWKAVPPSRFKIFQEKFCREPDYVIPAFNIHNGHVRFYRPHDFDTLSLDGTRVSPDFIADDLAYSLDLVEFEDEDVGDPLRRFAKKSSPKALAKLKKVCEAMQPLMKGERRVYIVSSSNAEVSARHADVPDPKDSVIGTVLYFREYINGTQEQGEDLRKRQVQHFTDGAYGPMRKTRHQDASYVDETAVLIGVDTKVDRAGSILSQWTQSTSPEGKEFFGKAAVAQVAAGQLALAQSVDPTKLEAKGFLDSVSTVIDTSGKPNPRAKKVQLDAVPRRTSRRMRMMREKSVFNKKDGDALHQEIERHQQTFHSFRTSIQNDAGLLEPKIGQLEDTPLDETTVRQLRVLILTKPKDVFRNIKLQPFLTYAKIMSPDLDAFDQALTEGNRIDARDAALRLHIIGKFQGACVCLEWINEHIIDAEVVPVQTIKEGIRKMHDFLDTHQIFPELLIPAYDAAFHDLLDLFQIMIVQMEYCMDISLSATDRAEMIGNLDEFIDMINLEEAVRGLQHGTKAKKRPVIEYVSETVEEEPELLPV